MLCYAMLCYAMLCYAMWQALGEFTREERIAFLKFTWGRSRLPAHYRFVVDQMMVVGDSDGRLPSASTCFFQLHLPPYSSAAVLKERLLYAVTHCLAMDLN